jgi:predicted nucleic acid-binding protein
MEQEAPQACDPPQAMSALTFDTGALIALERGEKRIRTMVFAAQERRAVITAPAAVVTEWWRKDSKRARLILAYLNVEPLTERLAKIAGEALAALPKATAVDAIVMASAALRGDTVVTSDVADLERLRTHFPTVSVLRA